VFGGPPRSKSAVSLIMREVAAGVDGRPGAPGKKKGGRSRLSSSKSNRG